MSILDCIVSYLKNTFKPSDEFCPTDDPKNVQPLLQKIYWRVDSIAQGIVKPTKPADRITVIKHSRNRIGQCHCRDIWEIEENILTFASAQGNVKIEITRLTQNSETIRYGMIYTGTDGRSMFYTPYGVIQTGNGYTVDQCRLAIIEFLDYLNDIIPATK